MLNIVEKIKQYLPINIIRKRKRNKTSKAAESLLRKVYENDAMDVCYVLDCFKGMGASQEQLAAERTKLIDDASYCKNWCKTTGFFKR